MTKRTSNPNEATMNARSSGRLLARKRARDDTTIFESHRPSPGASAFSNDCGILPSEWYRIAASITPSVPWGFVCGYPTSSRGDLYGGSHYTQLASSTMTPQGQAMKEVTIKFGDGCTLPYTPCKKGYIPMVNGEKRYACSLHHKDRLRRLNKEGGKLRKGEMNLKYFWDKYFDDFESRGVDGLS